MQRKNENKRENFVHNHRQNIAISAEEDHVALKSSSLKRFKRKKKKIFKIKLPFLSFAVTKHKISLIRIIFSGT